jgi:hypothetical protein
MHTLDSPVKISYSKFKDEQRHILSYKELQHMWSAYVYRSLPSQYLGIDKLIMYSIVLTL